MMIVAHRAPAMRCAVALVRALIATKEIVRRASNMPRKK